MGCTVLGFTWFAAMSPDGSFAGDVLGPAVLVSVGGGFGFVVLTVLAVAGVPPRLAGVAGGLVTMSQQVGGALGLALLASAATWWTDRELAHGLAPPAALTGGFRVGFLIAAVLVLTGTVAAALTVRAARLRRVRAT